MDFIGRFYCNLKPYHVHLSNIDDHQDVLGLVIEEHGVSLTRAENHQLNTTLINVCTV